MKVLYSEKIKNAKTLFEMKDKNDNIIYRSIEYNKDTNLDKTIKIIIIVTEKILSNLKNNQIN